MSKKYYCGPFWMPKFLQKWASFKFNHSCKIHDEDYALGELTQKEADDKFLVNMIKQANGKFYWMPIAGWYWLWVRMAGWISYKNSKKERLNNKDKS